MTIYDNDTYLQSLATSRGDIDRQVANAMAEINRQRGVAQGAVRDAGEAVAKQFQGARQNFGAGMNQIGSSLGSLARFSQPDQSLFQGALATQQGGFTGAVGLLGQGFDEQATQRRGAAQNLSSQLQRDVDVKANEYIARRAAEERQRAFEQQQAEIARQHAAQLAQEEAARQQGYLGQQAQQAALQRAFEQQQAEAVRAHLSMLANPPRSPAPAPRQQPQQVVGIRDARRPRSGAY